ARDNYDTTINSRRLYTTDKDGNRQYLSDSQLAAERLEAREQVDAISGPQGYLSPEVLPGTPAHRRRFALCLRHRIIQAYVARRICRSWGHGRSHGEKSPQ